MFKSNFGPTNEFVPSSCPVRAQFVPVQPRLGYISRQGKREATPDKKSAVEWLSSEYRLKG